MKIMSKLATWGLIGLIGINVAGSASYFLLERRIRHSKPKAVLTEQGKLPLVSGIDVRGAEWRASDAPCRVIRIADDGCAYCKKDQPSYAKILDAARRSSCQIIEIAPKAKGLAYNPRPGVTQLDFVAGDVGAMLFPFVTPQTIIVDKDWSVQMTKRGTFDEKSLARALSLIAKMPQHGS